VPEAFTGHDLPLGPYSLASQFSNAIFTAPCDAVILSIQPDVTMSLMRHRRDSFLFYPIGAEAWPAGDRAWLQSNFEASGLLGVGAAMNNLAAIVAKIRERSEVPILIDNLSPIIPGDQICGSWRDICEPHPQVQPGARGAFRKQRDFDHRCRCDRGAEYFYPPQNHISRIWIWRGFE
jgi:hypothetical protein